MSATPLDQAERLQRAAEAFSKALIHLAEARRLGVWGQAPNACIHSAYYAMKHCAMAVLYATGGVGPSRDVPRSHEHIIQHFGKLVVGEPGVLGDCGRMLSRARADRMTADYGLVQSASSEDAAQSAVDAERFIDACVARWSLAPGLRKAPGKS